MTASRQRSRAAEPASQLQLLVSRDQLDRELAERITLGEQLRDRPIGALEEMRAAREDYYSWTEYNEALLKRSFDQPGPAQAYSSRGPIIAFGGGPDPLPVQVEEFRGDVRTKLRRLSSLRQQLPLYAEHPELSGPAAPPLRSAVGGSDVFVVHGHDGQTKETVARFLGKLLDTEPIILHEQPDRGRTIIEKFEDHAARAGAAVVLLTGDDTGGPPGKQPSPRARQNVVLELGFFLGKLGRGRVIILYEPGVELPSDLSGVLYVELDRAGGWRAAAARELQAAQLNVDLRALL